MSCETELRATQVVLPNSRKTIWVPHSSFVTIRAFTFGWIGASSVASNRVPMLIAHAPSARAATKPAR